MRWGGTAIVLIVLALAVMSADDQDSSAGAKAVEQPAAQPPAGKNFNL